MRHFDMINIFGNVLWTNPADITEYHIVDEVPEAHKERFLRLIEKLGEEQIGTALEYATRKMAQCVTSTGS